MAGGRRRWSNLVAPAYVALASLAGVVVLPSVLRPPPEQSQSSAALSPDAPTEDEAETIVQSMRQAASRTAGAIGGGDAPVTTTSTVLAPSRGRCFGDPPRQTESSYSPPCRAAFTGDNGGATHKNVSADEVRVAFFHDAGMPRERGPISTTPPSGESAEHRTARVLQEYVNQNYELYGRRLQLVAIEGSAGSPEEELVHAVRVAEEYQAFASVHLGHNFCEELARRDLVCFNTNGANDEQYERSAPNWWSYVMSYTKIDRMYAEYACKKLVGRNAEFAAGKEQGRPRKIAVVVESTPRNQLRNSDEMVRSLDEQCGFTPALTVEVDPADTQQMGLTLAQLQADGITTVLLHMGLVGDAQLWLSADNSAYFPEWVMVSSYGMDISDIARLIPTQQLNQTFGMSGWELPKPFQDTDCYRAYKTVDPAGAPNENFCRLTWETIEHIVNGIQEAGPDLNPETFKRGQYSMPLQERRHAWSIGGGFGPGDHSFVDDLAEIWWDATAPDPAGGEPGTWRHTQGGKRWRPGELDDVTRVFSDGVTGYQPGQPQ